MLASIWYERNAVQYRGDRSQIPITRLLAVAEVHGQALMDSSESSRKRQHWEEDQLSILKEAANPPLFKICPHEQKNLLEREVGKGACLHGGE